MPGWKHTYLPYQHQFEAFERLTTRQREGEDIEHAPEPTVLTTGTGSGKTESFLYPLLDYVYRQRRGNGTRTPGIKAIVLYPMNALATDQAARFAEAAFVMKNELGFQPQVGLLVGEGKGKKADRTTAMTKDRVVEDRATILNSPPDILLTNFKMLDYALMRDGLNQIWRYNLEAPGLLKFLVLDELHTYDGAQGTDVANLIRRLKLKLESRRSPGQGPVRLVPVGTSATVGEQEQQRQELASYVAKLFGEPVSTSAIVGETRQALVEVFGEVTGTLASFAETLAEPEAYRMQPREDYGAYQKRQCGLWGVPTDSPATIRRALQRHPVLRAVVDVLERGRLTSRGPVPLEQVRERLLERDARLGDPATFDDWLGSLLAIVPLAKETPDAPPLLYLRSQLWLRELSGVEARLSPKPAFTWASNAASPTDETHAHAAPAWNCRDCGASGWLVHWDPALTRIELDRKRVLRDFFAYHKRVWFALPTPAEGYRPPPNHRYLEHHAKRLDGATLELSEPAPHPSPDALDVTLVIRLKESGKTIEHHCPACGSEGGVSVLGGRKTLITSVLASQLLSTPYDAETPARRKALAFSNAVQDAAHVAGYAESKSFRFTFRSALLQVLREGRPKPLDRIPDDFETHWMADFSRPNEFGPRAELAYVTRFFPPDKDGRVDFRSYLQPGEDSRFANDFIEELNLRIRWEIYSEFGLRADRGRTLLRSGSAGLGFDESLLDRVMPGVLAAAQEFDYEQLTAEELRRFVVGVLHLVRLRGAIAHPFLDAYRHGDWNAFLLNHSRRQGNRSPRHYLNPQYFKGQYAPRLFTPDVPRSKAHIEALMPTTDSSTSTLIPYFYKAFAKTPYAQTEKNGVGRFLQRVFARFAEADLTDSVDGAAGVSYALRPSAILVARDDVRVSCDTCGLDFTSVATLVEQVAGVACFRESCKGHLRRNTNAAPDYYRRLYDDLEATRVYAADHTGLLERDVREKLERDFRARPEPDSPNLLVATSTLEMGIDIGDLNAVVNTMVPPATANYLQRIGRAGRKSGTAQVFNIAAASKPHDLYYFAEPVEMMNGQVDTPGCFLEARDILRRHFVAYVLDQYTAVDHQAIPDQLKRLKFREAEHDATRFPSVIAETMKREGPRLLAEMRELYHRDQPDNAALHLAFDEVAAQLTDGSLPDEWLRAFYAAQDEWQSLDVQLRAINQALKEPSLAQADPRRVELQLAKQNLSGSRKRLQGRQVLEHLTNHALLPNYAFPEAGVTLEASVILPAPKSQQGDLFEPDSQRQRLADQRRRKERRREFEVVRPASSALREMMPGQRFYTQGYKHLVSSVVIDDLEEQTEELAFCSRCDHLAPVTETPDRLDACPKCQDASFAQPTNRHHYFRPQGVRSFTQAHEARIRDEEERDRRGALVLSHLDLRDARGARMLKSIPFGVEYNAALTLRRVCVGDAEPIGGWKYMNQQVSPVGFITCKACGHATTEATKYDHTARAQVPKVAADYHVDYCRKIGEAYTGAPDDTFGEYYFSHVLNTEALRILLPASEVDSEEKVAMFASGLMLGIREEFRGRPDHLDLIDYVEYPSGDRPQRYLVLYDTVPGGTGYLGKLFEEDTFDRVLRAAHHRIANCACQEEVPDRDGCYRCVLSYRARHPELMSRARAAVLFGEIVDKLEGWDRFERGFGKDVVTGVGANLEESELEELFVDALSWLSPKLSTDWTFERRKPGSDGAHTLTYGPEPMRQLVYRIEAQYDLRPEERGSRHTVPDFKIALDVAASRGTLPADHVPVALFADGYAYHASGQHDRFGGDVDKRFGLLEAGLYLPWTLTYADVEAFVKGLHETPASFGMDEWARSVRQAERRLWMKQTYAPLADAETQWVGCENSVVRLLELLKLGVPRRAIQRGARRALLLSQKPPAGAPSGITVAEADLGLGLERGWGRPPVTPPTAESFWPATELPLATPGSEIQLRIASSVREVRPVWRLAAKPEAPQLGYPMEQWRTAWQVLSVLGVALLETVDLPHAGSKTEVARASAPRHGFVASNYGGDDATGGSSDSASPNSAAASAGHDHSDYAKDFDAERERAAFTELYLDEAYRPLLEAFIERRWREGEDYVWGFDLVGDAGRVLATAEVGSRKHGFVIDVHEERQREAFETAGLRVFDLDPSNFESLTAAPQTLDRRPLDP